MNKMERLDINKNDYPITRVGSVKDIRTKKEPTESEMGEDIQDFSDRTSVKDFGDLGFATPGKGASMCATAVFNLENLGQLEMPTAYIGQIDDTAILVNSVRVIDPEKEGDQAGVYNRIFPVEVIARDVITATSSAAKRLKDGRLHPDALGLTAFPWGDCFPIFPPKTYVDGSTKLRKPDQYLSWYLLKDIACATTSDMNAVDMLIRKVTEYGRQMARNAGFLLFDHKVEFGYDPSGNLILIDVPLCLDEVTGALVGPYEDLDDFTKKPFKIFQAGKNHSPEAVINASKQLYRDHYDAEHPEWCADVKRLLREGAKKSELPAAPQPPQELVDIVGAIYQAFANAWAGEDRFNVPSLARCVEDYRRWATDHYELRGD